MHRGVPLNGTDGQMAWLENLRELIKRCVAANENAVLACSALKRMYRKHLRVSAEVELVFIAAITRLVSGNLRHRRGHFMNPGLLRSQFADFEEPEPEENGDDRSWANSARLVRETKRSCICPSQD